MLTTFKSILQFSIALLLVTLVLCGGAWYVQQQVDYLFLSGQYIPLVIFLYLMTVSAYAVSVIGLSSRPELGVFGILGGITIKMIISLSFFIFLLYRFPEENRVTLGLNFFCIYFFLTGFEVIVLLRNLRRKIE